jgi:hypothetical protein
LARTPINLALSLSVRLAMLCALAYILRTMHATATTRPRTGESLLEARRRLERAIMARQRLGGTLQSRNPAPQHTPGALHVEHQPHYLTTGEGARLARFDLTAPHNPRMAFRKWLRRWNIPVLRRGRVLLVDRRLVLAALQQ